MMLNENSIGMESSWNFRQTSSYEIKKVFFFFLFVLFCSKELLRWVIVHCVTINTEQMPVILFIYKLSSESFGHHQHTHTHTNILHSMWTIQIVYSKMNELCGVCEWTIVNLIGRKHQFACITFWFQFEFRFEAYKCQGHHRVRPFHSPMCIHWKCIRTKNFRFNWNEAKWKLR